MDMKEIMEQKSFAVLGDTVSEGKFAHIIKDEMINNGYTVFPVGKELSSINDIPDEIDVIDVCINPKRALELLRDNQKDCKCVVLQPGTEDEKVIAFLEEKNISYTEGCLLKGLKEYR